MSFGAKYFRLEETLLICFLIIVFVWNSDASIYSYHNYH